MAKTKERKNLRTEELRNLSTEELKKKEEDLRRELVIARIARANQQLKNPLKLRALRRDVARILTIIKQKGAPSGRQD